MDDLRQHRELRAFDERASRDVAGFCEVAPSSRLDQVERFSRWHGDLARIVEAEIIPRMMLALRAEPGPARSPVPTPDEIAAFADLVLSPEGDDGESRIDDLMSAGLSLESLLLDLLAPTARHLGVLWEEDLFDFTEITIAMGRLQRITRNLMERFEEPTGEPGDRSILLLTCPGETHSFGLTLLERFFRDAGWDVTCPMRQNGLDPLWRVRGEWFDVVGLSLGCEALLPVLAETVRDLRKTSRNPDVRILVGGPVFVESPDHATRVGADATAGDARDAIAIAERLLDLHARPC